MGFFLMFSLQGLFPTIPFIPTPPPIKICFRGFLLEFSIKQKKIAESLACANNKITSFII